MYRFLKLCNETKLDKKVLDCGAGRGCPPLSLFYDYGYETKGIDIDIKNIKEAEKFEEKNNMKLNIEEGDMRKLKFQNESFSFVYSYNSVFHMSKEDVLKSINEMKRVLKRGGLLFVNFLTTNDFRCGTGCDKGLNQYLQIEDDMEIMHSYFEENEADKYFKDMKVIYKEDRTLERIYEGKVIRQGFVDYIVQKL